MRHSASHVQLRLRGGLGNQLYGLAVGWVVASSTKGSLVLDGRFIPWEGSNSSRQLELDKFEFIGPIKVSFRKTIRFGVKYRLAKLLISKLREVFIPKSFLLGANVGESISDVNSLVMRAMEGKTLQGYFQDLRWVEKAFEFGFPTQLKMVSPGKKLMTYSAQVGGNIAVHIRLGDFLDFPDSFLIPEENYYLNGLSFFRSRTGGSETQYWVFTDDAKLALERFPRVLAGAAKIVSQKDLSGAESLFLMSEFSKIITSNSSFSTWAALFSSSRGGQVVCPETSGDNVEDLRPIGWTRVL